MRIADISFDETLLGWLFAGSLLLFIATLILIPILVARIPEDYFCHRRRHTTIVSHWPMPFRILFAVSRTVLGIGLVLAGVAMLVLPGQGLLTILIGLSLMNFPGKYRLEKALVRQPPILRGLNWLRARSGRPPLLVPD